MIRFNSKQDCCGCEACAQVCPSGIISMQMDDEGFRYPVVDRERCTQH
jgi:formate hydrogenlyase subunit 6/NADH:ubiquinone oxidoreductase subunit I